MPKWLDAFEIQRSPSAASASVGIDRSTPYDAARIDKVFAKAWEERKWTALDQLEASAMTRAIEGWEEPVFHEGVECGRKRRFSDRMTEFLLRNRHAAVFNKGAGDRGDEESPVDQGAELRAVLKAMFEHVPAPPDGEPTGSAGGG